MDNSKYNRICEPARYSQPFKYCVVKSIALKGLDGQNGKTSQDETDEILAYILMTLILIAFLLFILAIICRYNWISYRNHCFENRVHPRFGSIMSVRNWIDQSVNSVVRSNTVVEPETPPVILLNNAVTGLSRLPSEDELVWL